MSSAGAGYRAADASADTRGERGEQPSTTDAQLAYLEAMVADSAAAIDAIKGVIEGAKATLKARQADHAAAMKALDAARGEN